jgi:hypothetical protein
MIPLYPGSDRHVRYAGRPFLAANRNQSWGIIGRISPMADGAAKWGYKLELAQIE